MPVQRWSGYPTANDDGYREWVTGETPTAAEFNADRYDALATHARANVSGMTSDPTCTASGLTVTVPVGTSWYARVGWEVVTSAVTVDVPDDSDSWLFCCSDGNIRGSASASPPAGFDAETSCLLCKVSAAGGTATVLNGERWFARRRSSDRVVLEGPMEFDYSEGVATANLLSLRLQSSDPEPPSAGSRLFVKTISGKPELHAINADGDVVRLTNETQVSLPPSFQIQNPAELEAIVITAPDVVVGPGEGRGTITLGRYPGGEVYDLTSLLFIDSYGSFHRLTDEYGLAVYSTVFGAGSDAALDFDGSTPVLGMTPSGGVYTLTRSIYPSELRVREGATVVARSYEIVCSGTATVEGTIHCDGDSGGTGSASGFQGAGGSAVTNSDVGGSSSGGVGGAGQTGNGSAAGTLLTHISLCNGLTGATGGDGGSGSSGSGGSSGAGQTVTFRPYRRYTGHIIAGVSLLQAGGGGKGGGGGGGDGTNKGGGGGGGGSGGGVLHLAARRLVIASTAVVRANGGNGGNGGSPTVGNCGGGGGGSGGSGGAIILAFESEAIHGSATLSVAGGSGGTGGSPSGSGTAGSNGGVGNEGIIMKANLRTGAVLVT